MIFQKHHWEPKFALPLWNERRAIVAEAVGGENVFLDAAHGEMCRTSFCEAVWLAWYDCSAARSSDPVRRDGLKVFEEYENPEKTLEVLETYEDNPNKRASLKIARERAFFIGWRAARDPLILLWTPNIEVDESRLTDYDRRTWATHL